MAEELDLHLLELARAEGEVPRRDLVAETLADLGDAEGNPHPRAVADVLEVDENALGRLGTQKDRVLFAAQRADDRLEHQVELPRLGQRAERLGVGAEHLRKILHRGQRDQRPVPGQFVGVLAAQVEELHGLVLRQFQALVAAARRWPRKCVALCTSPSGRRPGRSDTASSTRGNRPCKSWNRS